MAKLVIFDLDGTTGASRKTKSSMPVPCQELREVIRRLGARGIHFLVVTGEPQKFGLQGAKLLESPEHCFGVAAEHGGWMLTDINGNDAIALRDPQVIERESAALSQHRRAIREWIVRAHGEPDDTAVSFISTYWPDVQSFEAARARASELNALVGDESQCLRFHWSSGDFSLSVLERTVSKAVVVKHLLAQGHEILLAAGDTDSDIPTLAAARIGIICTEREQHSEALTACFADRIASGTVLLAPGLHGHGLATCLNQLLDKDLLK